MHVTTSVSAKKYYKFNKRKYIKENAGKSFP